MVQRRGESRFCDAVASACHALANRGYQLADRIVVTGNHSFQQEAAEEAEQYGGIGSIPTSATSAFSCSINLHHGLGTAHESSVSLRFVQTCRYAIIPCMVKLRFSDEDSQRKAIGYLAGRYPFKLIPSGHTLVPEAAVAGLAGQSISFSVEGQASYDETTSTLRSAAASEIQ